MDLIQGCLCGMIPLQFNDHPGHGDIFRNCPVRFGRLSPSEAVHFKSKGRGALRVRAQEPQPGRMPAGASAWAVPIFLWEKGQINRSISSRQFTDAQSVFMGRIIRCLHAPDELPQKLIPNLPIGNGYGLIRRIRSQISQAGQQGPLIAVPSRIQLSKQIGFLPIAAAQNLTKTDPRA